MSSGGCVSGAGPSLELTEGRIGLLLGQDTGHPGALLFYLHPSRGREAASTRPAAEAAPECPERRSSGHGHRGLRAVVSVPGPVAKVEEVPTVTAEKKDRWHWVHSFLPCRDFCWKAWLEALCSGRCREGKGSEE